MSIPLVTLGVPVYNEAEFLDQSLRDLRAQTYPHLEILLADNGSTDESAEICRKHAAEDPRVKVIRHPRNLGQNANFNYLPRAASGAYFAWVSGHDLLDPDYAEKCAAVLEGNPDAVLAYQRTVYMKKDGTKTAQKPRAFDLRGMSPSRRFRETMWRVDCNIVYGMWRLSPMLDSGLFRTVPAADRVFLAEMAAKGTFLPADTAKYYRANRGDTPQTEMEKRHRLMRFIAPHRSFTDAELAGNGFYRPTVRAFHRVAQDAGFGRPDRWIACFSVWLSGVMKFHLFPGADALSTFVKAVLPKAMLRKVMGMMR